MFELKHLRSLLALRQSNSLAAAAESLHMSQSALSHQLSELEQRLGGLFIRKSVPLQFTQTGLQLLTLADRVLPEVDMVQSQLGSPSIPSLLRLTVECYSCIRWLTPALLKINEQFPSLELDLAHPADFEPQSALLAGSLDMVLTADVLPFAGIYYAPLFDFEMRLVIPAGHRLAGKSVIQPDDLLDEVLLSYPVSPMRLDVIRHFLHPAGIKPKQIKTVDNTLILTQMVAAGWGVTVLPDWVCHEFEDQGLLVTRSLGNGLWRRLHAAIRVKNKKMTLYQALIRVIGDYPLQSRHAV